MWGSAPRGARTSCAGRRARLGPTTAAPRWPTGALPNRLPRGGSSGQSPLCGAAPDSRLPVGHAPAPAYRYDGFRRDGFRHDAYRYDGFRYDAFRNPAQGQ
ncbi:hypothetical protein GCM10018785_18060 [Streptomyces longispororuber]|uniref:Uncharacterized protein n=1 Tax=Streptomyces longispororuber TaxID=68230 RepID=A0A918ZGR4_9ACTN|nr:hypothetical protein GCM10018785_18060 [Streptomyces longispororuber]